ncbi:MAG: hypothetical protein ACJ8GN_14595 [Longimicrobiaceae bacterium]
MELPASVHDPGRATTEEAVAVARARLNEARAALLHVTGGASARDVLAELAGQLAAELAAGFDALPMHRFTGRLARGWGLLDAVLPGRAVPHRVVLGRYLSSTLPARVSGGSLWSAARIAVLALGADGVLRVGAAHETVHRVEGDNPFEGPLACNDRRMRGVPSRPMRVARWQGGAESEPVAVPSEVLDALATIAADAASTALRELELLRRLLGPGGGG